jgi:hypothetical protein
MAPDNFPALSATFPQISLVPELVEVTDAPLSAAPAPFFPGYD